MLTFRMFSRHEWLDDPNSVCLCRSAHVDNGRVQTVEDSTAEDGDAHALKMSQPLLQYCNMESVAIAN